jgi:site-specific DNA-cytosine methylase
MKILIACEESQEVCKAFREKGHEAYSCDIEPCSGGHPEWHLQQDVIPLLDQEWDMIIAFPPCTYLTMAGTRHFSRRINTEAKVLAREKQRKTASEFFMLFANAKCKRIVIENPVGFMNSFYRKPDQIIHPYYFGEPYQKRTCLWLKGLPKLDYSKTIIQKPEPSYICQGEKCKGKKINWCEALKTGKGKGTQKERAKARSKTFSSIARAMAEQWGKL